MLGALLSCSAAVRAARFRLIVSPAAAALASLILCSATPAAAAGDHTVRTGTLTVEQSTGNECPPPARLARVALVEAGPERTLFIGDELVKAIDAGAAVSLGLRDPMITNEEAPANQIAFDRWPDPSSAQAAFQFMRHRCRVTAARIVFEATPAANDARTAATAQIRADMALLASLYAAGRANDPRPATENGAAVHERLRSALGDDHAVTIEARFLQMLNAQDTGNLDRAIALGDELRERFTRLYGAQAPALARLRASLAFTQWRAGRSADAIAETQAVLATLRTTNGPADRFTLAIQRTLAEYLARSSRFTEALDAATEAEATARGAYGDDSLERIDALATLFRAYFVSGRSGETRQMLTTLLPKARAKYGPDHRAYVALVDALANATSELRLFDESDAASAFVLRYREKTLGPTNNFTISALINVASSRAQIGRMDEAERLYLDAYRRLPQDGSRYEPIASIEYDLASFYLERDDLAKAQPFVERVVERMRTYYGEADGRTLKARALRAEWLRRTGDPAAALPLLTDVLARQATIGGTADMDMLFTLSQLARAHLALGQDEIAAERLGDLVARSETLRDGIAADATSRRALLSRWVADYKRLAVLRAARGESEGAFALAELSKGRSLLDQMSEQSARGAAGLGADEQRALQRLALEIAGLEEQLANAAPSSPESIERVAALAEARARYRRAKDAVAAAHPRYAALTRIAPVDAARAGALLARDEVAVSYLFGDDVLLVFVLDGSTLQVTRRAVTPSDRANIEAFAHLAGRLPGQGGARLWQYPGGRRLWSTARPAVLATQIGFAQLADELGAWLLEPVLPALRGKRRLLVSPDGLLATVPFETLTAGGVPLIQRFEVAYVQSMSVYARIRERAGSPRSWKNGSVLAVGAPTFGTAATGAVPDSEAPLPRAARYRSAGLAWEPLPEAAREIAALARTFPGTRVLVGDQATEERLLALDASGDLAKYRYLHFATHAFFSSDTPELSAIVLRQPGGAESDGFVTVGELPRYRLNSELTVLSACETAAGRIVDGEGVMGFAYALLVAGNRSTIAALWKVPDESTRVFMEHFFQALRRGATHAGALASAKRALQKMPAYAAPLHWAGFVLYGS